jgi:hypothetical protein
MDVSNRLRHTSTPQMNILFCLCIILELTNVIYDRIYTYMPYYALECEFWIQAVVLVVVEVYWRRITYIVLSNIHLEYSVGFRLQLSIRLYWTGLYGHFLRAVLKRKETSQMKSTVSWDITPCSLFKINRRFGGIYRLHLPGQWIRRARNQRESR